MLWSSADQVGKRRADERVEDCEGQTICLWAADGEWEPEIELNRQALDWHFYWRSCWQAFEGRRRTVEDCSVSCTRCLGQDSTQHGKSVDEP